MMMPQAELVATLFSNFEAAAVQEFRTLPSDPKELAVVMADSIWAPGQLDTVRPLVLDFLGEVSPLHGGPPRPRGRHPVRTGSSVGSPVRSVSVIRYEHVNEITAMRMTNAATE